MEENMQNPMSGGMPPMAPAPQKKSGMMWVIVAVVLVVVLALLWWQLGTDNGAMTDNQETTEVPTEVSPEIPLDTLDDTTPVINQELESINTGDIESEFETINQDLENL